MKVIMHSFAAGRDPTLQWIESPVQRVKLVQKHTESHTATPPRSLKRVWFL